MQNDFEGQIRVQGAFVTVMMFGESDFESYHLFYVLSADIQLCVEKKVGIYSLKTLG